MYVFISIKITYYETLIWFIHAFMLDWLIHKTNIYIYNSYLANNLSSISLLLDILNANKFKKNQKIKVIFISHLILKAFSVDVNDRT